MADPEAREPAAVERVLALKAFPAFAELGAAELSAIAERATAVDYDAGSTLVGDDVPLTGAHYVLHGEVEERRRGLPSRVVRGPSLAAVPDGLAGRGRGLTLTARTAVRTLAVDTASLEELLDEHFDVLTSLMRELAREWIAARRRLGATAGFALPSRTPVEAPPSGGLGARIAWAGRVPSLRRLPVRTLGQLVLESEERAYGSGDALWHAGDDADHAVLLLSGAVSCRTASSQRFGAGPRSVLGLEDCVAQQPRWHDATATADVRALRLSSTTLFDVLEDDTDVASFTLRRVARQVARMLDRLAQLDGAASTA